MDAEQLRHLQAPLKARYKAEPGAGIVTLQARGRVSQDQVTCAIEGARAGVPVGLHPAAGGDGSWACSGDMLLEALVGCAGVTLAAVATAMGVTLGDAVVVAEGEVDFRGTLGVARDVPVGFSGIRLRFELSSQAPAEKLAKLLELTERYCVVFQTLAHPPTLSVSRVDGA